MTQLAQAILNRVHLVSNSGAGYILYNKKTAAFPALVGLEQAYIGLYMHKKFSEPSVPLETAFNEMRKELVKSYTLIPKGSTDIENMTAESLVEKLESELDEVFKLLPVIGNSRAR